MLRIFTLALWCASTSLYAQPDCDHPDDDRVNFDVNELAVSFYQLDMYWNGANSLVTYPADSLTSPIYAGAFWFHVLDTAGLFQGGAQLHDRSGGRHDYRVGVLDPTTGQPADSTAYCQIHTVTRQEIDAHLADVADGSLDNPIQSILLWPGQGNTSGIPGGYYGHQLAPFIDVNSNSIYEPELGDYPEVAGDIASWWAFHLAGEHDVTRSQSVPLEVHVLAQASS